MTVPFGSHSPDEVTDALAAYDWPCNIRELRNVVERAMILSRGETFLLDSPLEPRRSRHDPAGSASEKDLAVMERRQIRLREGGELLLPMNHHYWLGADLRIRHGLAICSRSFLLMGTFDSGRMVSLTEL